MEPLLYTYIWIDIYIYMCVYMIYRFIYVVHDMYTYLWHYLFDPIILQMRRTDARLRRTDAHNLEIIYDDGDGWI